MMFNESFQLVTAKLIKETCQEESLKRYLKIDGEGKSPSEIAKGLVVICCTTMIHTAIEAHGELSKKENERFFKIVGEASDAITPYIKNVTLKDLTVNKERFFKCVEAGIIAFHTYISLYYFD